MILKLYSTVETEDAFEPVDEIGEIILEDGELEVQVDDDELADELLDFFSEFRQEKTGDPSGMRNITLAHDVEPGSEKHLIASIPILLEEFEIIAKIV